MSLHADPPPPVVYEPNGIQYQTADQLGKGGFAICYRAEQCVSSTPIGKTVALKIVKSQMEPQKLAQKFITELQLHSKLRHPNIVEFFRAFSFEKSTYVVLEICDNGSLADALKKRKFFSMPEIRRFLIQTCGAVKYLHNRNIVHRDLKTGNIFLDRSMNVKVGDFGLAAVLVGKNEMGLRRTTMCGTPNYLAPEILEKGGKGHNEKVDLWAIGIIAYTLAVGKAPFHAAKREEIYKKLQNREYEWPDLSKHPNDISSDLRDLVGSLLVDEDDRPGPDTIVSHSFFKMSFIPDQLDSSCTSTKPNWTVKPPTSETIRRGYSEGWFKICKASGVGEYGRGRFFSVVGAGSAASVVKDVEREIKANRAPTVPIAPGTVYLPYVSDRKEKEHVTNLSEIAEEREPSKLSQLVEISTNDGLGAARSMRRAQSTRRMKENVPPVENPPDKQTLKRVRSAKGRIEKAGNPDGHTAGTTRAQRLPSDPSKQTAPLIEKDGHPAGTTRAQRLPQRLPSDPSKQTAPLIEKADGHPAGTTRAQRLPSDPSKETAPLIRERVNEVEAEKLTEANEVRKVRQRVASKDKKMTIKATQTTTKCGGLIITRCHAAENRPEQETSDNAPQAQDKISPPEEKPKGQPAPQKRLPVPERRRIAAKRIADVSSTEPSALLQVPHTDPQAIWLKARELRNNLADVLSRTTSRATSRPEAEKKQELPFVSKWVDYSKKHGIGYVLTNGTVGCIFNRTATQPVTHVVVRDGYSYLSAAEAVPSNLNIPIDQLPVEIYSDGDGEAINRLEVTSERRRANAILWTKFARYMCQTLSMSSEGREDESRLQAPIFVRYYQRLGTVGVWGFSNGCFQFNFPDHTKIVLSADGTHCSFTCLPAEAMAHIAQHGDLPTKFIKQREVLTAATHSLLHGASAEMARANLLRKKLHFIFSCASSWVRSGGLGNCGEGQQQRPLWKGPHLDDAGGKKVDWIAIGGSRLDRETLAGILDRESGGENQVAA